MASAWYHRVAKLNGWRSRAFLLALAERAYPHLSLYADMHGLEKLGRNTRRLLDKLWTELGKPLTVWDKRQADASEEAVPEATSAAERLLDDWWAQLESDESFGAIAASHSIELLEAALRFTHRPDREEARRLAEADFNLVLKALEWQFGEGLDDEALIDLYESHALSQDAMRWQRSLLAQLEKQDHPDARFLATLRKQAENDGVSSLGIGGQPGEEEDQQS